MPGCMYGFDCEHKNPVAVKIFLLLKLSARWDRSLPGTAGTRGTRILLPWPVVQSPVTTRFRHIQKKIFCPSAYNFTKRMFRAISSFFWVYAATEID